MMAYHGFQGLFQRRGRKGGRKGPQGRNRVRGERVRRALGECRAGLVEAHLDPKGARAKTTAFHLPLKGGQLLPQSCGDSPAGGENDDGLRRDMADPAKRCQVGYDGAERSIGLVEPTGRRDECRKIGGPVEQVAKPFGRHGSPGQKVEEQGTRRGAISGLPGRLACLRQDGGTIMACPAPRGGDNPRRQSVKPLFVLI